jgi:hypothetical protein
MLPLSPHPFTHSAWLSHHSHLDFINQTILYLQQWYVLSWGKEFLIFQRTVLVPPSPGSRCPKKPFLDYVTMKTYPITQHNIPADLNLQQHRHESLKHHDTFNKTHTLLNDWNAAIYKSIFAEHYAISSWPVTCFVSNGHSPLFSELPLHYL